MSPRRRQTARQLFVELVLVVALIGGLYVLTFSGAAAELGRIIGQTLENQLQRPSPSP